MTIQIPGEKSLLIWTFLVQPAGTTRHVQRDSPFFTDSNADLTAKAQRTGAKRAGHVMPKWIASAASACTVSGKGALALHCTVNSAPESTGSGVPPRAERALA